MNTGTWIFKGNIAFSISPEELKLFPNSYIVVDHGTIDGIYKELPQNINGFRLQDFGNQLIIPGFTDLHVHAPQCYQRGLGMNMELTDWLEKYTFQREAAFSDTEYAKKAYRYFTDELVRNGTLHASVFATIHKEATRILFETLQSKGIAAFVGKVNMDRNCLPAVTEDTVVSIRETEEFIKNYANQSQVRPILTPRFVPTCSSRLLDGLGKLAAHYDVPVQSHLSENRKEVKWVGELHPELHTYANVYHKYGLFGQTPTLMAHCIYLQEEEIELMKENNVIAVHCPDSNINLTSGFMPVRKLLKRGIKVGLGSDVGGGHNLSMAKAVVGALQMSKAVKLIAPEFEPLTFEEAFYMATKGNGSFFGKVGSFEAGYGFDAIIIDDSSLGADDLNLFERLQRFIYIGDDRNITTMFVNGHKIT